MLLGFKRQFAPFVEEGSKTHTIRGTRKITPRVGETCHCYVDPRQKTMRLLGRWPCVKVQDVQIFVPKIVFSLFSITIEGQTLSEDELDQFAFRDGFRTESPAYSMYEFWLDTHGPYEFAGSLIHWEYSPRVM